MNIQIRFSWPAWWWINTVWELLCEIFSSLWYSLVTNLEYESRIKWWSNNFDICVSLENPKIKKTPDVFIIFDKNAINKNIEFINDKSIVILPEKFWENILKNSEKYLIKTTQKFVNIELLIYFCKIFWIKKKLLEEKLNKKFWWNYLNLLDEVFSDEKIISKNIFSKIWEKKNIYEWNELVALWAIDWWLDFYSAYPMTPASSIYEYVLKHWKWIVKTLQPEDELAVVNAALWASFTNARSAFWTSWWGFALTTEALSFAIQAELPITAFLSQRAGPSTWTPTYLEQWDINFALNPTFWDFNHILLYPSTFEEVHYLAWLALNLADIYQTVVILLIDKQISESIWTVNKLTSFEINRGEFVEDTTDYKRYKITPSWISPRVNFWEKWWEFIATSYEHDEYWATSETVENKKIMTEKKFKKLDNFTLENDNLLEIINPDAEKFIITFWFNAINARVFVKNNPEFWLLVVKIFKPLDSKIKDILKNKKELIFAEVNYSSQFANHILKTLEIDKNSKKITYLNKYDLHPFFYEDFEKLKN